MRMMKKILIALTLALPLWLCGITPRVFIEPHAPVAGEVFMIVVELDSDARAGFEIPPLAGIRISDRISSTRSNIRIINGKREATISYGFHALVDKPGKYTLPPLKITVGQEILQTDAITFTVRDPAKLTGLDELEPDRVQLRMRIAPERPLYIGETAQVAWELIVPRHIQLNGIRDIQESGLGDALFVPRGRDKAKFVQTSRRRMAKNGIGYDILEFTGWFQPQIAGEFSPKVVVSMQISVANPNSFFPETREITVRAAAAPLTVLPLPQLPAGAIDSGLIGDWQISFASLPKNSITSGEVAELTLNISGSVPTEIFHAPEVKIPHARAYPPEVKRVPDGFTVKYPFVPLMPGNYKLELPLAVFDPEKRSYRIEKCVVSYTVAPGKTAAVPAADTVKTAKNAPVDEVKTLPFYPRKPAAPVMLPLWENIRITAILLTVAGVILAIAGWFRHWRKNSAAARNSAAVRRKIKTLIRELETAGDTDLVLQQHGLADMAAALQLPPGATAAEIASKVDDAELKEFFLTRDENYFRPGGTAAASPAVRGKLLAMLKKLILIIGICAALPLAAGFDAGRKAYDRGDYQAAGTHFRNTLDPGAPDPHQLFNIGCSEYMAGDYPDAALAFEQAYLLMPGDTGIKAAWDDSRTHLPGYDAGKKRDFAGYIADLRDMVRPDRYILTAALGIFLLGLMVFAGKFPYRKTAMLTVAIVTVTAGAAVYWQSRSSYSPDRARIVAAQTEVRRLPAADGSVAGIVSGGTEVRIIAVKGDWVQIQSGDELAGWVAENAVKRIMPHGIW